VGISLAPVSGASHAATKALVPRDVVAVRRVVHREPPSPASPMFLQLLVWLVRLPGPISLTRLGQAKGRRESLSTRSRRSDRMNTAERIGAWQSSRAAMLGNEVRESPAGTRRVPATVSQPDSWSALTMASLAVPMPGPEVGHHSCIPS